MLHEYRKIDVYELKGMIRRAGLLGATIQLKVDGKNSKACYLAGDMPESYDNKLVKDYSMSLSKKLVTVTLAA